MGACRGTVGPVVAALLAAAAFHAPAHAQVAGFDPADYGRAQLPERQSTGDAARFIEGNRGAFEPISELDPKDPLYALARPIGRLDVVMRNARTGQETGASCTAELVAGDYVLTNHHCLPQSGDMRPVKASLLMDYLTLDGKGAKRFEVSVAPEEFDAALDFAVAKVEGAPTAEYGAVALANAAPEGARSLMVIHHPLGRPKVMSRFRCLAAKEQADGAELRHRCDTLGGSSGSLLFDAGANGVALHKEGGLDPADATSFNTATRMAAILDRSRILQAAVASGAARPGPAPAG
ncbi:trypsin-like serine peptidase, partial [Methylopila musalis]